MKGNMLFDFNRVCSVNFANNRVPFIISVFFHRVIPSRKRHPAAYRLYIELLKRYVFSLPSLVNGPNYQKYD